PGWRLLGATGVDEVPGTWVSRWTLLDLFLVLVIALAVRHLWGTRWGLIALAAMILSWQEPDAPQWMWIVVLALEALRRLLPAAGQARQAVRALSVLARIGLVLYTVSFVAMQARQAIYPALERSEASLGAGGEVQDLTRQYSLSSASGEAVDKLKALGYVSGGVAGFARTAKEEPQDVEAPVPVPEMVAAAPSAPPPPPPPPSRRDMKLESPKGSKPPASLAANLQEMDPRAVADTGPGLPDWEWTQVALRWSGPVETTQRVRFFLLSPLANRFVTLVRAVLLLLLLLLTLNLAGLRLPWRPMPKPPAAAALLLAVLLLAPALTPGARAANEALPGPTTPPGDILDQLRQALTEKPDCFPGCAASPRLFLEVSPAALRARFEVGAAAEVAVPIPGGAQQWVPAEVQVDGQPAGVARTEDGRLWVKVGPGRHEILLAGALPPRDGVQIALPLKPHRVEVTASGWTVSGVHEDGEADDTLQLTRLRGSGPAVSGSLQPGALPTFLEVARTVRLGLTWTVETRVSRRSPAGVPAAASIPLLPGESVTTSGIRVKDGAVQVSLGPQADEVTWTSSLAVVPVLALAAPRTLEWAEVWRLDVSPIWHFEAKGIPAVLNPTSPDPKDVRVPEWRPWPGERVELAVSRPEGIAGHSLTVVHSQLTLSPGVR